METRIGWADSETFSGARRGRLRGDRDRPKGASSPAFNEDIKEIR